MKLSLFRNYVSMVASAVAVACLASILLLFLLETTGRRSSPYIGIFAWMIIPAILICSLIVMVVGALRERRRRRSLSPDEVATHPSIDLSDPRRRTYFLVFLAVSFLFVSISAFGSYQAYEHTESVAFCGQTCHTVMKPEFVAYQNSPHRRLDCVECHVGQGARWYVKSKLKIGRAPRRERV